MHRFVPLLAILALSCGPTARPDFVVHLVNASNNNPFNQCNSGTVRVDVQQSTNAPLTSNANITSMGTISSLAVGIPSYGLTTQIEVTVSCVTSTRGTITLIGATPHFIPVGYGFVDIVLGEPQSCELLLPSPTLVRPRVGPHLVALHANLIALGGLDDNTSPALRVQVLDPVTLTFNTATNEFPALTVGIGLGEAVPLGNSMIVFASDTLSGVFDASAGATTRVLTPNGGIHAGAGSAAVVGLIGSGAAVIGGAVGADAVDTITWISADGATSVMTHLVRARRHPTAALVGPSRLLVIGGQAAGEELFELVPFNQDSAMAFGPTNELRFAPVVATDASRTHAFVAFGTDAVDGGAVVTSTWALSNCGSTHCDYAPGTPTSDPRSDVAVVAHTAGAVGASTPTDSYETLVIGGFVAGAASGPSTLIDRIRIESDGTVTTTPFGNLTTPRTSAGATDIGGGIVIVGGGIDDHTNVLASLEICFPAALRPIGPE